MSEEGKTVLSISEAAELLQEDINSLSNQDNLSDSFRDVLESPAPIAMLRQLNNYGVENIELPQALGDDPLSRFNDVMIAGDETLRGEAIPAPHLEDYYAA